MDDSFDEDFSDIDDTDFEEMDFLDDEDDIDMDDEPLPFSPSSDFDNADSDASTSSKERSAIDDALDLRLYRTIKLILSYGSPPSFNHYNNSTISI